MGETGKGREWIGKDSRGTLKGTGKGWERTGNGQGSDREE